MHMATGKKDRRKLRSRRSLQHALLKLMLTKPYDKITIQNIVDGANVGRSTFYAHYRHKDDFVLAGHTAVF